MQLAVWKYDDNKKVNQPLTIKGENNMTMTVKKAQLYSTIAIWVNLRRMSGSNYIILMTKD